MATRDPNRPSAPRPVTLRCPVGISVAESEVRLERCAMLVAEAAGYGPGELMEVRRSVPITEDVVGRVIGKGGETIQVRNVA